MDQFFELYGMKVEVQGHLPPGTMVIVSPDVMQKLRMDPRVGGPGMMGQMYYQPPGKSWESLGAARDATIRTETFDQFLHREGVGGIRDAMGEEYRREISRLHSSSRMVVEVQQQSWRWFWWHDGERKGWWE